MLTVNLISMSSSLLLMKERKFYLLHMERLCRLGGKEKEIENHNRH